MRIACDGRGAALDFNLQLADAAQELVVELTFSNQAVGLARACA
jgi:hypothetical protein